MQTTSHILMIRPVNFGYNPETAVNNAFQVDNSNDITVHSKALQEFDAFVSLLQQNGVDVTVINDTPDPYTPDSIFPNNWVSFHAEGVAMLYPMYAENRRKENKPHILETIGKKFELNDTLELAPDNNDLFLEGTGSMVLDRENKIAYACISPRTAVALLEAFCQRMGYRPVYFTAVDQKGLPIYHTNVMMCVADRYAVICLDSIKDAAERNAVVKSLRETGKEIVEISLDQMNRFAGNMLQVNNKAGDKLLIMSTQAYQSLTATQIETLEKYNRILHSPIETIETNGGGSARCMIAEIHLPVKNI